MDILGGLKLADNANIKMEIRQTADGQTDNSELFTKGEYRQHDGCFYIDYDESEATGFEGSHVQLCVKPDGIVTMTRTGRAFSSLVFEKGQRHFCHYGTEFGDCMIGITTSSLHAKAEEDSCRIAVKYSLDVNSGLMLENEIVIKVNKTK